MPDIRILSEADLRKAVTLDGAVITCIDGAFRALAGGDVEMPPILSMAIQNYNGEIDVKTAYIPGVESFAVKMSPGFFDNPKIGLPSTSGLMVLFAAQTGQLEALLLDNGYLTDIRTAAAGAVAAQALSREDAQAVTVLGTGMQARLQLMAIALVRPLTAAVIWGRDPEKAAMLARELTSTLGIPVTSNSDAEAAVQTADIIVTTTPATDPILFADWLRPGQHVTAMGSDQPHKMELDPACLARADLYVADRRDQTRRQGELRGAIAAGTMPDSDHPELGQILCGDRAGRTNDAQITIADLTGTGVQDTSIATLAYKRAAAADIGVDFTC